jgi:hypothetical protein
MLSATRIRALLVLALGILLLAASRPIANAQSQRSQTADPPYIVEWVYKVKFGYQDEFWKIFQKYQIGTLNKEKAVGNVLKYEVFRPGLHTSEDHRWDFRIVIYYKSAADPAKAAAIEKQLFPDQATLKREELRRWELTEVHWDLPIRQIDPNANEE